MVIVEQWIQIKWMTTTQLPSQLQLLLSETNLHKQWVVVAVVGLWQGIYKCSWSLKRSEFKSAWKGKCYGFSYKLQKLGLSD